MEKEFIKDVYEELDKIKNNIYNKNNKDNEDNEDNEYNEDNEDIIYYDNTLPFNSFFIFSL